MNIAQIIQQLDLLASRSRLGLGLCELRLRQRFDELPIPPGDDPRQFLADVAPNLDEFLAAALAERSLPSDYYEAAKGDDCGL